MSTREMWPEPFHVQMPHRNPTLTDDVKEPFTRTSRPPKYYIIDFGMSRRYPHDDPHPTETAPDGADRTVPEFNNSWDLVVHDPFRKLIPLIALATVNADAPFAVLEKG